MSKRSKRRRQSKPMPLAPVPGQQVPLDQTGGTQMPTGLIVAQASAFSGPLPPPTILREYDDVLNGAAERIFKMAETQASHRQDLERSVIKSDIRKSYFGLAAGFLVAVVAILGGSFVAYNGQPWAGVGIGGAPVVALVWAFLKGTSDRREEREIKARQIQNRRSS